MVSVPKEKFMLEALVQAELGLQKNNFPVGAVLVIDDHIVDKEHNRNRENHSWSDHAELLLLLRNSPMIKDKVKKNSFVGIYSTLEPCLMCYGSILQHRLSYLVYSVEDSFGGSCSIVPGNLPLFREKPLHLTKGFLKEQSLALVNTYLEQNAKCKLRMGDSFK